MGEQQVGSAAPEGQVAEGASGTPPAAGEGSVGGTPESGVAPVEQPLGAGTLSGDESPDEVEKHLRSRYAQKLTAADLEQLLRWRKGAEEGKSVKVERVRLQKDLETAQATRAALDAVAELMGGDSASVLKERGPKGWMDYLNNPTPQPQVPAGLDPKDPVHAELMRQAQELATLRRSLETQTREGRIREKAQGILAAIEAVKLPVPDDDAGTSRNMLARLVEFNLASASNPEDPSDEDVRTAIQDSLRLLDGFGKVVTGQAKKREEEAKPKVPAFTATTETRPPTSTKPMTEDEELRGFVERAKRRG